MKTNFLVLGLVLCLFLTPKLLTYQNDLDAGDEGINLNAYWKASRGLLVYRDFSWNYGPLAPFLFGMLFKAFGVHVQVVRLLYLFVAAVGVGFAFWIARFLLPPLWAGIASLMAFSLLQLPPHSYNHIFGTFSALWVVAFFLSYLNRPEGKIRPFLIGIGSAVGLLTKPLPMGGGIFVSVILFVLLFQKTVPVKYFLTAYFLGIFCVLLPVALYLGLSVPVQDLLRNLLPIGSGTAAWRYHASYPSLLPKEIWLKMADGSGLFQKVKDTIWHVVNVSVWWSPVLCALVGFLFFRKEPKVLFLALFSILIYAQPLITGSDGVGFLMEVPFVLMAYLFYRLWNLKVFSKRHLLIQGIRGGIFLFVGYFILFAAYVDLPLQKSRGKIPLSINVAKDIRVPPRMKEIYEKTVVYVRQQTAPTDRIFVVSLEPGYYFLCQRDGILKDDFATLRAGIVGSDRFHMGGLSQEEKSRLEDALIEEVGLRKPKCIIVTPVTYFPYTSKRRALFDYIQNHYILAQELGHPKAFGPDFDLRNTPGGYSPYYGVRVYRLKEKGENSS